MGSSPSQQLPPSLTPEQKAQEQATYADLKKRGMSYDIDEEIIGAGKDLAKMAKKNIVDPAMKGITDIGKSISASHAGTQRQSTEGEFKGTSQTKEPTKSLINTTADEAMAMGLQ